MKNSNFPFGRFFLIFANILVFICAFFVLTMIAFYTITALSNQITELTTHDSNFCTKIASAINEDYFSITALIIYMGSNAINL
ncbi:hypothetical protein [Spiroplasma endosymbiont of Agriotes lineatus]|uniref:hypothetical protein n=1 Tax=Spiroplasma endosymbiont of Agriotes lineatus TaxID=3077930 RepID=UPI0030D22F31